MKALVAAVASLALLALAAPARGDVGFESASRVAGAPGDRVDLTIGCGFCFPPCVGTVGRRHPPGARSGACMLGSRRGPPAYFPVWLTPLRHSLDPYMCDLGERCRLGARPPRLPSFVYLGRAGAQRGPNELGDRRGFPRYRLTFGVPEVPPGRYKYVLFCEACIEGPRGSLIESRTLPAGRLRVEPQAASVSDDDGGALPWLGVGMLTAIAAVGGRRWLARR